MTTNADLEAAMKELAGMRREIIALLLPLHTQLGFNVIENRLVPGPTIMLSPSDFDLFKELVAALPAPSAKPATTGAVMQSPPAGDGPGPTLHVLWDDDDKEVPQSITDKNGNVVLNCCKVCGRAEAELSDTPFCDGPVKF